MIVLSPMERLNPPQAARTRKDEGPTPVGTASVRAAPGPPALEVARDYETVGYVISGRAELHSEGQMVLLESGNAWVVPWHARHTYKILEPFTAVEATHPPAEIHDRDRPAGQANRSDSEQDSG